jgi:hypothetical protein
MSDRRWKPTGGRLVKAAEFFVAVQQVQGESIQTFKEEEALSHHKLGKLQIRHR